MKKNTPALRAAIAAVAAGALLLTSACTSQSSQGESSEPRLNLFYVSQSGASNSTNQIIVNGMQAAADQLEVDLTVRYVDDASVDQPGPYARLLEQAVAEKPDGMVLSDAYPDALNGPISEITAAGTPVQLVSSGAGQVDATGVIGIVAPDEYEMGALSAQHLKDAGVEHPLLATLVPGLELCDQRNAGFLSVYGDAATVLALPLTSLSDPTSVTNAIEASLAKDAEIDGVLSVGLLFNASMLAARDSIGDRAHDIQWGTIDFGQQVLDALKAGDLLFAAEQQPYLQGYLAVTQLVLNIRYGFTPAQRELKTEPAFVTADNYEEFVKNAEGGIRG